MDRAEFLKRTGAATAGLALAALTHGERRATAQTNKPNLLLILTDDQQYWTLTCTLIHVTVARGDRDGRRSWPPRCASQRLAMTGREQ